MRTSSHSSFCSAIVCFVTLVPLLAGCRERDRPSPEPPVSVVLISIDTLRADHLGAYGYERPTSPRIDQLAARSALFTRAYSQAPVTAPSHMTMMTGLYPEAHGVGQWASADNHRLSDSIPTLASILREQGYATEAYTGGGNVHPKLGFDQGFDVYETDGQFVKSTVDKALLALDRFAADPDRPFLLFVHTHAVHDPYLAPKVFRERFVNDSYDGNIIGSAAKLHEVTSGGWGQRSAAFWDRVDEQSTADRNRLVDLYDSCIAYTDAQMGRLLDGLAEHGLSDNTLVVLTSDHGEQFQEHGAYGHHENYQEILHVPLMLALPRNGAETPRRQRVEDIVRLVDLQATILDVLGLDAPEHGQGRSLLPLLDSPATDTAIVLSQHLGADWHVLRVQDWKLISKRQAQRGGPDPAYELYDLATDPGEQVNLVEQRPEIVTHLLDRLESLRAQCRALKATYDLAEDIDLDASTREQLKGLGYLGR